MASIVLRVGIHFSSTFPGAAAEYALISTFMSNVAVVHPTMPPVYPRVSLIPAPYSM